jgi:hypothetical protein
MRLSPFNISQRLHGSPFAFVVSAGLVMSVFLPVVCAQAQALAPAGNEGRLGLQLANYFHALNELFSRDTRVHPDPPSIPAENRDFAISVLKNWLNLTNDQRLRLEALYLVSEISSDSAVTLLLSMLDDTNEQVKTTALDALARFDRSLLNRQNEQLCVKLTNYAWNEHSSRLKPAAAILLLGEVCGASAIEKLRSIQKRAEQDAKALFSYYQLTRAEACRVALCRRGDPLAKQELGLMLRSPEEIEVFTAIKQCRLLGASFGPELVPLLDDNRLVTEVELMGSGDIRYRIREFAAMELENMYTVTIPRSLNDASFETFLVPGKGVFKKLKQDNSDQWIRELKTMLPAR